MLWDVTLNWIVSIQALLDSGAIAGTWLEGYLRWLLSVLWDQLASLLGWQ